MAEARLKGRKAAARSAAGIPGRDLEGGAHRVTTPTDSVTAARSDVASEMFSAITRTVSLVQAKEVTSMNRVELTSDACAISPWPKASSR